jgi:hypothetical protein
MRWTWINQSFEILSRRGVPTDVVRYESFVRRPIEELRRIASFAGVPLGTGALDAIRGTVVDLPADHLVAGNRMRFASGTIELREDDEWVSKLGRSQRRSVSLVTWPLLRRYGYASAPESSDP